ncbi:hypothetical protein C8Q79DRAFT_999028 [Trametes meyenii]|nr:hypothetical protein C8Q79DRAFT_999028 [Trametes meyenii]
MAASSSSSSLQPPRIASPEIIDVDALEDTPFTGYRNQPPHPPPRSSASRSSAVYIELDAEIALTGSRRRSPRRATHRNRSAQAGPSRSSVEANVIILDSDDEAPSHSLARRSSRNVGNRTRLLSPPPPAAQRGHTPGVPPLSRFLAPQASIPRRHRAEDVPPPIRPVPQPLVFEARVARPRLARPPPAPAAPLAAAPSHHRPSMSLGGAMISLHGPNARAEANHGNQAGNRLSRGFNLPNFTDILRRVMGYGDVVADVPPSTNPLRRWRHGIMPWTWDDVALDADEEFLTPFGENDHWFSLPERLDAIRPGGDRGLFGVPAAEKVPFWKPEYTHSHKLSPGFTHDFAPADDPSSQTSASSPRSVIVLDEDEAGPSSGPSASSSATAVETTLPLVLAPADSSSPEDAKMRRVWALRCGHMLDGKCVQELMQPPEPLAPAEVAPPEEPLTGKGKGRWKPAANTPVLSAATPDGGEPQAEAWVSIPDRKGKRKAVEPPEPEHPKRQALPASAATAASSASAAAATPAAAPTTPTAALVPVPAEPEAHPPDNSIRSRLRSRARAAADVSPPSSSLPGPSAHVTEAGPAGPPTRRGRRHAGDSPSARQGHGHTWVETRGRGKGKGKGRAKVERKPAAEAEHEWRCPVAGCGCVHYGVRVAGVWVNDEGRGAIPLFV